MTHSVNPDIETLLKVRLAVGTIPTRTLHTERWAVRATRATAYHGVARVAGSRHSGGALRRSHVRS